MPVVEIPDIGNIEFPDTMSADDISKTIREQILPNRGRQNAPTAEPAAAEPQTPRQRSGPLQSPLERVATGGVMGFAAPEAMMALGRGLVAVPYAPAKAAGYGLQAAAPLVRMGGRFLGAAGGAAGGLAGGVVESTTRNAGASPALADMLGNITEIGTGLPTGLLPAGRAMRASTAPREYPAATPEQLRASVGGAAEDALTSAQQQSQTLRRNQLRREIETRATGRAPERQPTDPDVMQQNARQGAQLPEPVNQQQITAGQDVDSQLRRLGGTQLREAQRLQSVEGGEAFATYRDVGERLQAVKPFADSPQGRALEAELESIIRGGQGDLRTSTRDRIRIAQDIKNELFPRAQPTEPVVATQDNLSDLLKNSPLPLDERIRMQQDLNDRAAANQTLSAPQPRAVDFNVVDVKLRELRQLEANRDFTGYTGVQRENYGSAADSIENALKGWVGESNYPRAAYAEASEPLNRFRTRLGEALTAREDIPYATGETTPGMFTTPQSRLRGVVFNDADSVRFASELLGEQQVHRLGAQHASDMLRGKTAEQVTEWLNSPANAFVDAIPGLRGRVNQYAQRLAADEARSAGMTRLQDQLRAGTQASRRDTQQSRENLERASETIRSAARSFANAQPEQMLGIWNNIKPRLEGTGLFNAAELDNLERMVGRSASNVSREERVNITREIGNEITRKLIGKVVGGAIGAETLRRILGF
jgi:hypothetical protein